jgi:5-methylthioadenosine/S-adenosylhomocysteine deaminase
MRTVLEDCLLLLPGRTVGEGDVVIEGASIAEVRLHPVAAPSRLVMPGLVNCHGHTPMTLVRGLGGGLPLQRWLEEAIFPVEAKMTPADIAAGMTWGALEMLAGGTTCVADMYDFPDAGAAALRRVGLKANLCRVGLAFPGGAPAGRLAECVAFAAADHGDGLRGDLCVHSDYLTDEAFCRALAAANRDLKRPVHVHVSETRHEHEACLARHGKTPVAYLAATGLFDFGGYAAHGVWCTDDDFRILRDLNVTLVHNPTSNLKLGSGFLRLPAALAAGVRVALGTDGCASNDNLDMFEEMHLASLIHKGVACDPTAVTAWDVIEMATVNGARALGRSDSGEIAVGRRADLCVVALDRPHLTPCLDVPNLIVSSLHASDVVLTMVDGRVLYDGGRFPTVDAAEAKAAFFAAVRRLGLHDAAHR